MRTDRWIHFLQVTATAGSLAVFPPSALGVQQKALVKKRVVHSFEGRVSAKNQIEVERFDVKSNSYHIVRPDMPFTQNGWLYATPESIAEAIDSIQLKTIKEKPKAIVGVIYATDSDLFLIAPQVIEQDPKFADVLKIIRDKK